MILKKKIGKTFVFCLLTFMTNVYAQNNLNSLNEISSCDSTCTQEVPITVNKITTNQKFFSCPEGYIGNKHKISFFDKSSVIENDLIDNCICEANTFTQEVACPTNQKGEHIQTRNWTCSGNAGSYSPWITKSNTCSTYPISFALEERTIACPSDSTGTIDQVRSFTLYSDDSRQAYSDWVNRGSNCEKISTSTAGNNVFEDFYKQFIGKTAYTHINVNSCSTETIHTMTVNNDGTPVFSLHNRGTSCSGLSCKVTYKPGRFSYHYVARATVSGFHISWTHTGSTTPENETYEECFGYWK